jgi:putative PIN family toxin of toxin-antitoxin system
VIAPGRDRPRVVLDTNVVLSALVFGAGVSGAIRRAWQDNQFQPLICAATAEELMRALGYPKFKLLAAEQEELLADYLPWCKAVAIPKGRIVLPAIRDPRDRIFLELAIAADADLLVTGDHDLHSVADKFRVPIVTPAAFRGTLVHP